MQEAPVRSVGGNILLISPGKVVAGTNLQRLGYYEWLWKPTNSLNVCKASKADEAAANMAYWAVRRPGEGMEVYRTRIRHLLLQVWQRKLSWEVIAWLRKWKGDPHLDQHRDAAIKGLSRCLNGSWFDWLDGSRLLYWR
jgi:hypothetical protein